MTWVLGYDIFLCCFINYCTQDIQNQMIYIMHLPVSVFVVSTQPVDSSSKQVAGNLLYLDVDDKHLTNKQNIAASESLNICGLCFGNFYLRGAVHQSVREKLGF